MHHEAAETHPALKTNQSHLRPFSEYKYEAHNLPEFVCDTLLPQTRLLNNQATSVAGFSSCNTLHSITEQQPIISYKTLADWISKRVMVVHEDCCNVAKEKDTNIMKYKKGEKWKPLQNKGVS